MNKLQVIVLIVSIILASVIINTLQQLFMRLIGAKVMFFNGKIKVVWIILLAWLIYSVIVGAFSSLFGI